MRFLYMLSSDHDAEEAGDGIAAFDDLTFGDELRAVSQHQCPLRVQVTM
jgi:hypothetical protein